MPEKTEKEQKRKEEEKETIGKVEEDTIKSIKTLTEELVNVTNKATERIEENAVKSAIEELTSAINVLRSEVAPRLKEPIYVRTAETREHGNDKVSGCDKPCLEVSKDCCCFEIVLNRVRVVENQKFPDLADGAFKRTLLELIFHVVADGTGLVYPSLTSHIQISEAQGWTLVNSEIRKYYVPCNRSVIVPLIAEAREVETAVVGAGRPEYGSNTGSIILRCGCEAVPAQIEIALSGGGRGEGTVEVEVLARPCSSC